MNESNILENIEFAENPEPRCPCLLLLDTSGSMNGARIRALNHGIQTFKENLKSDPLAMKRVEIAIITFDNKATLIQDFITVDQFSPPQLTASGSTYMGTAILTGLNLLDERKQKYKENGIGYYRPWIFLITDGEPQGEDPKLIEEATVKIKHEEARKKIVFFAVGVEEADMEKLKLVSVRTPLRLNGLNFKDLFIWLSSSMQRISQSKIDDQTPLPPAGWGVV